MKKNKIFLSVVAPAYNEADGIYNIITSWVNWLKINEPNYEIIICDDGSNDDTWENLEKISKKYNKVRSIRFKKNQGAAIAHSVALSVSSGKWILMIDSDGQFDIKDYKKLYEKQLETGARAVIGERKSKSNNFLADIGSALSTWASNFLLGTKFKDFNSVFKLIDGNLARSFQLDSMGFEISTEITAKLVEQGVLIASILIPHRRRLTGKSKLRFFKAARSRYLFVKYLYLRSKFIKKNVLRKQKNYINQVIKGGNWKND